MNSPQTQHDIGTLKNKPYGTAKRALNALKERVEQVGGKDAVSDDFHVVKIASKPKHFVIRHKHVCVVNNITLEPFYLYGVEFIDTKIHCGSNGIKNPFQRFDCMVQAKAYATSFNLLDHLESLKIAATILNEVYVKPIKTVEQIQRESLCGQTIFEHINGELTLNRQRIKVAIKNKDHNAVEKYQDLSKVLRHELWRVEDNAKAAWDRQDYSLFNRNNNFPSLTYAFEQYFEMKLSA